MEVEVQRMQFDGREKDRIQEEGVEGTQGHWKNDSRTFLFNLKGISTLNVECS